MPGREMAGAARSETSSILRLTSQRLKVEAASCPESFRGWKPRSTVEKVTVLGHSHPGCGAGGHPACRQVSESDRQDAYLPHSQDGCAPSSGALFNKAKSRLLLHRARKPSADAHSQTNKQARDNLRPQRRR